MPAEDEALNIQRRWMEAQQQAEQLVHRTTEQSLGRMSFEGQYHIDMLGMAEVKRGGDVSELEKEVFDAIAYGVGLDWGRDDPFIYNIDRPLVGPGGTQEPEDHFKERREIGLTHIMGKWLTVEDGLRRPGSSFYLWGAAREALEGRRKRVRAYVRRSEIDMIRTIVDQIDDFNGERLKDGESPYTEQQRNDLYEWMLAKAKTREAIKEAKIQDENRATKWIVRTKEQLEAIIILDAAYIQRMLACEYPDGAAQLLFRDQRGAPSVSPEVTHLKALFYGDFGQKVDRALRAIVRVAVPPEGQERRIDRDTNTHQVNPEVDQAGFDIPTTIYATNFDSSSTLFAKWREYIRSEADGDELAAFTAWKLALTWELPGQFGWAYEKKGGRENVVFADPSVGNAINPFLMTLDKKQEVELGLDPQGNRFHTDTYVSYAGPPLLTIGPKIYAENTEGVDSIKFRPPCESYLHNSKITIPKDKLRTEMMETLRNLNLNLPEGKLRTEAGNIQGDIGETDKLEISLFDLWYSGRFSMGGRLDEEGKLVESFPWIETERTEQPGEVPKATYAGWRLRVFRAWDVIKNGIQLRPSLAELSNPDFFGARCRNWGKVFGPLRTRAQLLPGEDYVEPWESIRTWWVAGLIHLHHGGEVKDLIKSKSDELQYRIGQKSEMLLDQGEGKEGRAPAVKDILRNAQNCGFLRPEDADWIIRNIGG
jgi:hypothetical protein